MDEEIQVAVVKHGVAWTLEVVVDVFVEGSTQTAGVAEVSTRRSDSVLFPQSLTPARTNAPDANTICVRERR